MATNRPFDRGGPALTAPIRASAVATAAALTACAAQPPHTASQQAAPLTVNTGFRQAVTAIGRGEIPAAREALAAALRAEPQNGYLHLLNGLTYELEDRSPQSLDLAGVGFDAAVRFAPGFYWAHYHDGALAMQRGQYTTAADQFASAILSDPDQPQAFVGLAVAAYSAEDLQVASRAISRALALSPQDPVVLRTAAFVAAGSGDRTALDAIVAQARSVPQAAQELEVQHGRLSQLIRTAAYETGVDSSGVAAGPATAVDLSQVMVEVTLLLSQNTEQYASASTCRRLEAAIKGERRQARRPTVRAATPAARDHLRPDHSADHLQPEPVQHEGRLLRSAVRHRWWPRSASPPSSSSAARSRRCQRHQPRSLAAGRRGDLGQADADRDHRDQSKFRVDAGRSFFMQATGGTFQIGDDVQAVSRRHRRSGIRQDADPLGPVEAVKSAGPPRVPSWATFRSSTLFNAVQDITPRAAIVLVTPRIPGTVETGTREFRGETLQRLLGLWQTFIEPTGSMDATIKVLEARSEHFRPLVGDVHVQDPANPQLLAATLADTAARLQ